MADFVTMLEPSSQQEYKCSPLVPTVIMLPSVLLLTLPSAFEADLKLQANVTMISLRISRRSGPVEGRGQNKHAD